MLWFDTDLAYSIYNFLYLLTKHKFTKNILDEYNVLFHKNQIK